MMTAFSHKPHGASVKGNEIPPCLVDSGVVVAADPSCLIGCAKPCARATTADGPSRRIVNGSSDSSSFTRCVTPRRWPRRKSTPVLTNLAVKEKVSASTQNQALSALLFLYRHVLGREVGDLGNVIRARKPKRLPVVMTREEVKSVLAVLIIGL